MALLEWLKTFFFWFFRFLLILAIKCMKLLRESPAKMNIHGNLRVSIYYICFWECRGNSRSVSVKDLGRLGSTSHSPGRSVSTRTAPAPRRSAPGGARCGVHFMKFRRGARCGARCSVFKSSVSSAVLGAEQFKTRCWVRCLVLPK